MITRSGPPRGGLRVAPYLFLPMPGLAEQGMEDDFKMRHGLPRAAVEADAQSFYESTGPGALPEDVDDRPRCACAQRGI